MELFLHIWETVSQLEPSNVAAAVLERLIAEALLASARRLEVYAGTVAGPYLVGGGFKAQVLRTGRLRVALQGLVAQSNLIDDDYLFKPRLAAPWLRLAWRP